MRCVGFDEQQFRSTSRRASRLEEALPHLPMATAMHADPGYLESVGRVERKPAA
jgi:hypothetical protein